MSTTDYKYDGYYKYPRTPHLPWSPGATDTDVYLDPGVFEGKEVVVTEKMDGENATMYRDHYHARSIDSRHHVSRDWIKKLHARVKYNIPEGWRICGENLFAEHSIRYENLPSYFLVFSIWTDEGDKHECLSWDETTQWCDLLDLEHVPVLWRGEWDATEVWTLADDLNLDKQEGYVVRTAGSFPFEDFQRNAAKWVRPDHVDTDEHWMHKDVTPNGLRYD